MTILATVATAAARYLVCSACKTTGVIPEDVAERAFQTVLTHFNDHSQKLPKIIAAANERAWKTVEIALGGDRFYGWLTNATDKSLANDIRRHLDDDLSPARLPGEKAEFLRTCLKELRAARQQGLLTRGPLVPQSLRQQAGDLARFADPASLADGQRQDAGAVAGILGAQGFANLGYFLGLPTPQGPLLLVAFEWYLTDAVAKDTELSTKLMLAKLDRATDAGMEKVAGLLDARLAEIEAVLGKIADIADGVRRIEEKVDQNAREDERRHQELLATITKYGVGRGELKYGESGVIRDEAELREIRQYRERVRQMSDEQLRGRPDKLALVARASVGTGDFAEAEQDFCRLATLLPGNVGKAMAHYNAYRAALECHASRKTKTPEDYDRALRELLQAARLDPDRYTPFDLHEYQPFRILGHGGFGVTIQCREVNADREVAIKVLLADDLDRKIEDVIREGQILAKLPHPNVVELKAVRFADPAHKARPYFVMEYLEGFTTLADHVQQDGPLKPHDVVNIARQIAEGLKAAHDKGIFHRDVKPANVMIRYEGEIEDSEERQWSVKIIDFGLAVRRDLAGPSHSTSGTAHAKTTIGIEAAGTQHFSSKEQLSPEFQAELARKPPEEQRAVRIRSDIYSFGKTCIYALCGDPDFDHDEAERLHDWRKILGRCTMKANEKRPKDFAEVLEMLRVEGLFLPMLPEDAIDTSLGPVYAVEEEDDEPPPPPPHLLREPFGWTPAKAAGASLLPGLGHLLFLPAQRVKGVLLLVVSVLLLLPLLGCLWPSMLVAWVLLVASDAFATAINFRRGEKMPAWSLLGVGSMTRWKAAAVSTYVLAVVLGVYFASDWLFGPSSKHREQIVGTWELHDGDTVEFTREGAALYHDSYDSTQQGRYRLSGRRTLEVVSSSRGDSHTDRYTMEFSSPDEMVLVAQKGGVFDGLGRGEFPSIAGKLSRVDAKPATAVEPDARLLGRWAKAQSKNNFGEEESIVVTAQTLLYSRPRGFGADPEQHSTPLKWTTSTKAKLAKGRGTIQIEVMSDKEIVVSFQGRSPYFDKITGRYRRAKE